MKTSLTRRTVWVFIVALGPASGVWLFGGFTRITQAQAAGTIRNRTGKFL